MKMFSVLLSFMVGLSFAVSCIAQEPHSVLAQSEEPTPIVQPVESPSVEPSPTLEVYQYEVVRRPLLDKLAKLGVKLENARMKRVVSRKEVLEKYRQSLRTQCFWVFVEIK